MMQKSRKSLLTVLLLLAFQTALVLAGSGLAGAAETSSAAKNGLVKTGNADSGYTYYFYKNGKKVTNTWKTITVEKSKYKFYFGKNGKAYKAPATFDGAYNVKVFTIGKQKYGFDADSHLVSGGIYVDTSCKLWVFTSKGKYNATRTKKLRKNYKTYDKTGIANAKLYKKVLKAFGKPLKTKKTSSCGPLTVEGYTKTLRLLYAHYEVQLSYNPKKGIYAISGFYSL